MGIQVNIGDHVSSFAEFVAVPLDKRDMTNWARARAKKIAKGMPGADVYFKTLPLGKSLTELLADGAIWINFAPGITAFGKTNVAGGKEIGIGPRAYRIGRWTVLATLIHELAHVDGVRGRLTPKAAEDALLHCGLGKQSEKTSGVDDPFTPYDPDING